MSDQPELRCEREDCGRYFDVENPRSDTVRCPHCGFERSVPDDLEAPDPSASTPDDSAATHITASGPTTIRITIEIEPGDGGDR